MCTVSEHLLQVKKISNELYQYIRVPVDYTKIKSKYVFLWYQKIQEMITIMSTINDLASQDGSFQHFKM